MLHIDNKSACLDLGTCEQGGCLYAFRRTAVTAFQRGQHIFSIAVEIDLPFRSVFGPSALRPLGGDLLSPWDFGKIAS